MVGFSAITGGLVFMYDHIGFDPLTGYGLPQGVLFYYYREGSTNYLVYNGQTATLNSTLLPTIPENQCYSVYIDIDIMQRSVSISLIPVDSGCFLR